MEKVNKCCPKLCIVDCADTDEHKHFCCFYAMATISNDTVKNVCIDDWLKCVNRYMSGALDGHL